MNKLLATDYLYKMFTFGTKIGINPDSYFEDAFYNQDFINMVECRPHNTSKIKELITNCRKSNEVVSDATLRYLAFLIVSFIEETTIEISRIPKYIDSKKVLDNYSYYHSKSIEEVIFELLINYNEKYTNRKMKFALEDDLYLVKDNLLSLFPLKRFEEFKETYDFRLSVPVFYTKNGEILLASSKINKLLNDEYFKNKYAVGQKVYCFAYAYSFAQEKVPSNVYFFLIKEDSITFYEQGGLAHEFKILKQKIPF